MTAQIKNGYGNTREIMWGAVAVDPRGEIIAVKVFPDKCKNSNLSKTKRNGKNENKSHGK